MEEPMQEDLAATERVMRVQEFCLVAKRVYDLPDDMEPAHLVLSDIDRDGCNELLIADVVGPVIIAKGHALFIPAEPCPLATINCVLAMDLGETTPRTHILLISSDGNCIVYNSPAFDHDMHTWVSTILHSQFLVSNITSAVSKQLMTSGKASPTLAVGHFQGVKVYQWDRGTDSLVPIIDMKTPAVVHSLDLLSFSSMYFIVLGYIDGKVEVWEMEETNTTEEGQQSIYSLTLVPGDCLKPNCDDSTTIPQPVCVKSRSDGTFVTCSITGQFAVGRIHTHPQLFWQIESTAETPDLLAFIDHSTIAPVEPLYNEQFVQSEHAEGPPYILSTPQSEVAGPESTVRGHESIRGAFDVTTMVGWNGWTYFLSKQSSVLPLFNASLLLKTPVKSYTIGDFGFEYVSVDTTSVFDEADVDSVLSLSLASEIPLIHTSSGVEGSSRPSLRFTAAESITSSTESQVVDAVGDGQVSKLSRRKSSASFREGSRRRVLTEDRTVDGTHDVTHICAFHLGALFDPCTRNSPMLESSSSLPRHTHSVVHNESCIAYGYARSVAVFRCLHSHLTEAFTSHDNTAKLPLHLFHSLHTLSSVIRSESQLETLPASISDLLKWLQQGSRLDLLGRYVAAHQHAQEPSTPHDDAATSAVVAHIANAMLTMSAHDVLQAKIVLQPPDRKSSRSKSAIRRVVSAPAFADMSLPDSDEEDEDDRDQDSDSEGRDDF